MKKGIKKINSYPEAEKDTLQEYAKMTPAERLARGMELEWFTKQLSGFRFTEKDKEGFILE